MSSDVLRVLQITDTHLFADPGERLLGVDTEATLLAVLASARRHHWPPDLVLATGDLAQDGHPDTYRRLWGHLRGLGAPAAWLAGNHDEGPAMRASGDGELNRTRVDMGGWRIVLLDSTQPGQVGGTLGGAELGRLADDVACDRHVLVCLHHQPVELGCPWLDAIGLDDREAFFRVIDGAPGVRAVLWGHIHQDYDAVRDGVRLLGSPSTCFQFLPGAAEFALDRRGPGYRWLELHADGSLRTGVQRRDMDLELSAEPGY